MKKSEGYLYQLPKDLLVKLFLTVQDDCFINVERLQKEVQIKDEMIEAFKVFSRVHDVFMHHCVVAGCSAFAIAHNPIRFIPPVYKNCVQLRGCNGCQKKLFCDVHFDTHFFPRPGEVEKTICLSCHQALQAQNQPL